jgi:hypothetical protein
VVRTDDLAEPEYGGIADRRRSRSCNSHRLTRYCVAECEAKRRIVALHEGATAYDGTDYCTVCSNVDRTGRADTMTSSR